MKTLARMEKTKEFWLILTLSFAFFLLRLPSLFEPYWYGDEGIYQTIGFGINNGRVLYKDIWDNKTPLLYVLYALFHSDQFLIRFASLLFGIASVVSMYFLSKLLFTANNKTHTVSVYLSTTLYAFLFAIPTLEGNIANAENFMLIPIITASYLLVKNYVSLQQTNSPTRTRFQLPAFNKAGSTFNFQLLISGVLLSLAFLTKVVAVFDLSAFLFFLFLIDTKRGDLYPFSLSTFLRRTFQFIRDASPILIGFFVPFILTILYFVFNDALIEFLKGAFTSNIGYVSYENKFLFAQGFLIIKLLILGMFCFFLFLKRFLFSTSTLFILTWFAFSLFNAFFAQRPYIHYLLVLLPSFSLLIGLMIFDKKYQKFLSIMCVGTLIIVTNNFWFYTKFFSYYQNFWEYMWGEKKTTAYQSFFDSKTPQDYALAAFLNSHLDKKDTIFIWGNNAQVYTMTNKLPPGRFTVAYHITANSANMEETKEAVRKTKPRYIIIMDYKKKDGYPLFGYKKSIILQNAVIYENQ